MRLSMMTRLAFLFVLLLAVAPAPALAQGWDAPDLMLMKNYSEAEKIGFAFYQLIGREPPLEDWISADPAFQELDIPRQYYKRYSERERLKLGFLTYAPHRDSITLHTKIRLRQLAGDAPGRKAIGINFRSTDAEIYFPFQRGPLWIAVQPRGLTREVIYPVTDAELARLRVHFGDAGLNSAEDIAAELVVLPLGADPVNPIEVGDQPLWPLHVELKALRLLDGKDRPVWTASASNKDSDFPLR